MEQIIIMARKGNTKSEHCGVLYTTQWSVEKCLLVLALGVEVSYISGQWEKDPL